jgi:hypothetical protein
MSTKSLSVIVPDVGGRGYKLLRWLSPHLSRVDKGGALYTLEVDRQKMISEDDIDSTCSGVVVWAVPEGALVNAGDVIAEVRIEE